MFTEKKIHFHDAKTSVFIQCCWSSQWKIIECPSPVCAYDKTELQDKNKMYTYVFICVNEYEIEWQRPSHRYQTPLRPAVSSIFICLFCLCFVYLIVHPFNPVVCFVCEFFFSFTKADACQINNLWQLSSLNSVNYTLCNLIALIMPYFIIPIPFHSKSLLFCVCVCASKLCHCCVLIETE